MESEEKVSPPDLKQTFSVAEYIEFLNVFFKKQEARVIGEVSTCRI